MDGVFRRRNLPHLDVEGKPSFITACLHGSLPAAGFRRIAAYRDQLDARVKPAELSDAEWEIKKHKLIFKRVDSILDRESPVKHFTDARLAEVVQNAFLHFADVRYKLFAYVVMPSHHHWMFLPAAKWCNELADSQRDHPQKRTPREVISHSVQSFTANRCNRLRRVTGSFWQVETFDHYARDESELLRIIDYIEQNPVVAGLVDKAEDYRWSSAHLRHQHGTPRGEPIRKRVV